MTSTDTTKSGYSLASSKDIDPEIGVVLQWHIDNCSICNKPNRIPAGFGRANQNHCPEYWEIIQEYSDYERLYGMMGNP